MTQIQSGVDQVGHQENLEAGHMDVSQNVATYHFFLKLTRWSLIVVFITLAFMAAFLT
jgi:hypothetical protein